MNNKEFENLIKDSFLELGENEFDQTWEAIINLDNNETSAKDASEEIITNFNKKRFSFRYAVASIVALFFIVSVPLGAHEAYQYNHYYQGTLDVNPSISFHSNKKHQITKVVGVNDDGKKLLAHLHIRKKMNDEEAISLILDQLYLEQYFKDGSTIHFNIHQNKKDILSSDIPLETCILKKLESYEINDIEIVCHESGKGKTKERENVHHISCHKNEQKHHDEKHGENANKDDSCEPNPDATVIEAEHSKEDVSEHKSNQTESKKHKKHSSSKKHHKKKHKKNSSSHKKSSHQKSSHQKSSHKKSSNSRHNNHKHKEESEH